MSPGGQRRESPTGGGSRRRRARLAASLGLLSAAVASLALACLIPDRGIIVLTNEDLNMSPVRFVEGIPLELEALRACDDDNEVCPLPKFTGLPTLLDPADPAFQFCICSENRIDSKRLPALTLYVEDQDITGEGDPRDTLRAAALLDWNPTLGDSPFTYVAYRSYLGPATELDLDFSFYETDIILRPRPYVRAISLSDLTTRFDLCNGAGFPIAPGFHTLTFLVTDREWFTTPGPMATVLDGVPDIANGATYDIETYVFSCFEEGDEQCGCTDIEDGS